MKRPLTIAAVQLPSVAPGKTNAGRQRANFALAEKWLDTAGRRGADIACIGETFNVLGATLTRKNTPALVRQALQETIRRIAPLARRHQMAVIAPILALIDGHVRNVAVVFDPKGRVIGRYFKVHCIENERNYGTVPGDEWPVFEVAGARIGVQICHDNSFPESARCLTLNGAEIIFWPHVMGGWGGEFMDILLRAPAIHNGIHFVPVCFGCPPGKAWRPGMLIGRSSIIGPDATIIADAGRHPGIALATIDLAAPRIAHWFTRPEDWVWKPDMLNDRRPDTYAVLTDPVRPQKPVRAGQ
ncbi:MAG: carbon-nitrogen hydrolase family protein [Opitutaceae bacterium]|nr:carbon-nitrogen hydrolase family protein [Opitutaceae bacterium]MBP9912690.1 carbon-nitrogen hydrolase family protein [Opitutaceae bacterium]